MPDPEHLRNVHGEKYGHRNGLTGHQDHHVPAQGDAHHGILLHNVRIAVHTDQIIAQILKVREGIVLGEFAADFRPVQLTE